MFEQLTKNIENASEEIKKIFEKIESGECDGEKVNIDSKTIRPMSRMRKANENVDENSIATQISDIIRDAFR